MTINRNINVNVRLDASNHEYTAEGYLIVRNVTISKAGVYYYASDDRYEAKLPEDLSDPESLRTLENLPIVTEHPSQYASAVLNYDGYPKEFERLIDSENVTWYIMGMTIDKPLFEDNELKISIKILNKDLIDEIKTGKRSYISLGFICNFDSVSGVYDDMKYTVKQSNIRYNHLAIVSNPRVGEATKIRLDSKDIIYELNREGKVKMAQINLNGVNVEIPDDKAPIVNDYKSKMESRLDSIEKESNKLAEENLKMKTDLENLKVKASRLDSIEKESLVEKVNKILGKDKVSTRLDSKEIKLELIKSKFPTFDSANASDDYIQARFDSIIELSDAAEEKQEQMVNVNNLQGQGSRLDSVDNRSELQKARDKYLANNFKS